MLLLVRFRADNSRDVQHHLLLMPPSFNLQLMPLLVNFGETSIGGKHMPMKFDK